MQTLKGSGMPKLMNIQMELRKCCNHPFLINGVEQNEMVEELHLIINLNLSSSLSKMLYEI